MKKITLLIGAILLCSLSSFAQDNTLLSEEGKAQKYLTTKGSLNFTFNINDKSELEVFTKELSILNFDPNTKTVYAWANKKQFDTFLSKGILYQVPVSENEVDAAVIYDNTGYSINKAASNTLAFPVGNYPTYADYVQQMQDFKSNNEDLVDTFSIGNTVEGRELLFVKISDNVLSDEQEPKLMLTSSMHGDEIAGYPMMLSLINHILTVYNDTGHTDHNKVKYLVENAEIWINPNANPDGTYYNSVYPVGHPNAGQPAPNIYVTNARRENANNVDLNRNYPDNVVGPHANGHTSYEIETQHFMTLAENNHFVISANFHGGTEVVNYPWDNTSSRHPDDDWFFMISKEYAVNCQNDEFDINGTSLYMDEVYSNNQWPGVTNGSDWYTVFGGRQDYMNFSHQCKETTIELSNTKILPESDLVEYWLYNKNALLDYLTQGTNGFRGVVKDAVTGYPIEATVKMVGHDALGSWTVSELPQGDFYRPIKAGSYDILIEAPCYSPETLSGQIIVSDGDVNNLGEIFLNPNITIPDTLAAINIQSTSADLTWIGGNASSYDLRYRQNGAVSWTSVNSLTNESYNLTNLNPDTDYEFQVRSNCNSTSSSYSSSFNFSTVPISYCNADGLNIDKVYISSVNINGVINDPATSSGYADFTALPIFNNILDLSPTSHNITVNTVFSGGGTKGAVSAWIDYNHDGTFSTNENILNGEASSVETFLGSFSIPVTAKAGETVLRIIAEKRTNGTFIATSCGDFQDGEVEDYTVFIGFDGLMYVNDTDKWTPNAPDNTTGFDNVLVYNGATSLSSTIAVNNLEVTTNATLTLPQTAKVTVNGDIISNNNITLESDSDEYSSLIVNGAVNGDIKYKRHVNSFANGNDLISAPVVGQTFGEFAAANSNIYYNTQPGFDSQKLFGPFNKTDGAYQIYDSVSDASEILNSGIGYRAASTNNSTFTFNGAVNTGNADVEVTNIGPSYAQWNLIGNPYTSYILPEDFLTTNIDVLDPYALAVYGYDNDETTGNSVWKIINSLNASGLEITPGQGFFVGTTTGGNISFTPSMRTNGTSDDFIVGKNTSSISNIKINLSNDTNSYTTDVYFTDNTTLGLDPGYDTSVFGGSAPSFAIYSHLVSDNIGMDMAIQAVNNTNLQDETTIPLGLNANQGLQLTISISEDSSLPEGINIFLEDNTLGTFTKLNTNEYIFTADSNLNSVGRFYLHFQPEALSVETLDSNQLVIYNTMQPKVLNIKGHIYETTSVNIIDIHGRPVLIETLQTNTNTQQIDLSNLQTGVYIVNVISNNTSINKKIIIK